MISLTRWKIAGVIFVILAALFIDGFGAGYQLYASRASDPNLGCNDISLRADGLNAATGTFTISVADGPGKGRVIAPPLDLTSAVGATQWPTAWAYNLSKGGGQTIATVPSHQLTNALAGAGVTRQSNGYHLAATIGSGSGDHKSFWLTCTSTVALPVSPSPSPSGSPGASPAASASAAATPSASTSTGTPKASARVRALTAASPTATAPSATSTPPTATSASPSPVAGALASPSPTATPNPSATPSPAVTGTFWVDGVSAPSLPVFGPWNVSLHKGLDLIGGSELTIVICHGPNDPVGSTCRKGLDASGGDYSKAQQETIPILQQRVNSLGVSEATVQPQDNDKIVVQIPGVDLNQAQQVIGTTARLHFATAVANTGGAQIPSQTDPTFLADQQGLFDPNQFVSTTYYPSGYHWKIDDNIKATNVSGASASYDQNGQPSVDITFDSNGASEWSKITTAAAAQSPGSAANRVAIFLDTQVLTAPDVQQASSANTQISGNLSVNQSVALANQINAGALPADISTVQSTSVSATLGAQTVKQALVAGAVGLLIIVLFMLGYYRFPGLLASVALAFYAAIVLAVFKLFGVTLSLPGLAGFVLSVGMAVDANVLIFERTRDELRHGRPAGIAVETGFRRAFPAIRDSNFSTCIACGILILFGSDVVRGFAITLLIGVIVSFFSAILITQSLFAWALNRKFGRNPRLYTQIHEEYKETPPKGRFDIVRSRNLYFLGSLAIIVPGILAIVFFGFRLGLDFAGGNRLDAHLKTSATLSQVQNTVNSVAKDLQPQVLAEAGNHFSIQTLPAPINRVQQISSTLQQQYGFVTDPNTNRPDVQVDTVGPTIAADTVRNAVLLILFASGLIALYLMVVFGRQRQISARRFAFCTFFKLLHDVFVLLGIWAILGKFSSLGQVDSLFITAVLTSVAFSIHDTIVVFDRVRENLRFGPRYTFDQVINLSTVQTMTRSLNTALTVVFVLLSLVLFGGDTIRGFVLALLIGIITGTYSSIFNASTLLVAWKSLDDIEPETPAPRRARVASATR